MIWNNSESILNLDTSNLSIPVTNFNSSRNMGVWVHFFSAFNCTGKYIAMFDDDTIPGNQWFENCIDCMKEKWIVWYHRIHI